MIRRWCWTTTLALVLALPAVARAAEPDPVAAEALFNQGREQLARGEFDQACQSFERSEALEAAVGTLLNLGDCYDRAGKVASAWGAYRKAASLAVERHDTTRARVATDAAARIEPRLARISLSVAAPAADQAVTRNGGPVDKATYGVAVPVDPGKQVVWATAPGRFPWTTTITIEAGEQKSVRIPPLAVDETTPPPEPKAPQEPPHTQRTIAIGLEIGGGVFIGAGLVFGGFAMAKWSSVNAVCPEGHCANEADRSAFAPEKDMASTLATFSTIGIGAGAAVLLTGLVLHATAPSSRVAITPLVDKHAAGMGATFRF